MEKRWLSVKETAVLLSLHEKTIYSLVLRGELPYTKIGGSVRIDKVRLEARMEREVIRNGR